MKNLLITLIIAIASLAAISCTGERRASDDLREAEMAIADGDMTVARSVADRLLGSVDPDSLSARELARLSIVYMHMAEEENDNTTLVATAADLYRQACRENPDSAAEYYNSLDPAEEALASRLHHIVVATDSATTIPDDLPYDTMY